MARNALARDDPALWSGGDRSDLVAGGYSPSAGPQSQASGSGYGYGLGGAAPSVMALAGLSGVDPGIARAAFGGITSLTGPVGMGLSVANTLAGGFNGIRNSGMLDDAGVPMSAMQTLGGFFGSPYSGTPAQAFAAMGNQIGPATTGNIGGPNRADLALAQLMGPTSPNAPRPGPVDSEPLAAPAANPTSASAETGATGGMGGDNGADTGGNGAEQGGGQFSVGGLVTKGLTTRSTGALSRASGLVLGAGSGLGDTVRARVPEHSFVFPADVVSALGDGNTMAGGAMLDRSYRNHAPKMVAGKHRMLDIELSCGEYCLHREHVEAVGNGDVSRGHAVLAQVVDGARARAMQRMAGGR